MSDFDDPFGRGDAETVEHGMGAGHYGMGHHGGEMEEEDGQGVAERREEEEEEDEDEGGVDGGDGGDRRRGRDDEDDDEDDEEDEEDEDEGRKGRKRAKRRHRRDAVSRFIDVEAEVDEEEDEEDEEEDAVRDTFIATGADVEDDDDLHNGPHARLDRHERELDDRDLAQIAEDFRKRASKPVARYTGDVNEVPQRLLMPSVHDASLWQVRVKPGRERDIVFSLMRKALALQETRHPLQIVSAFQRDSLSGMIYVEARSAKQVSEACNGLVGVYPSRGISLVPIDEMASLLQIKKQDLTVTPGSWVRIRRGKYQGDLAQVMDITENGEDVGLKFIPRIDLNPRDDVGADGKKRKKVGPPAMRPPQRFFNYEEVVKVHGPKSVSKRNQVYVFQGDTYKDGFVEKDFKLSGLVLENVNPTLDEITRFTRGQDGAEHENNVDLSIIAEASRKAAISVLQPGDHIEVFEGEQAGVHGVVKEVDKDVVTISAMGVDIDGQSVVLPARSVRKRFKPGDHVKVMTGQNADETGLVVSVADNVVTFLSDMSMQEISVFSKDLREAAEVGSGTNIVGNYELHDLVQLDMQTVGVIFKTERDSFRVLDQNGQIRLVQPHQISMRRDSDRAIATDSEGYELRINDNMKEIEGEGRKGRVLHIHQSFFAFLYNRDIAENGGVFVTRARSLASVAPKGNLFKPGATDLSKMNPHLAAPTGGMVGSGVMGRGPRDRLVGLAVMVVKGAHKGYLGAIKDTNGPLARVELQTGNKVITIEKDKLLHRKPNGQLVPLEAAFYDKPSGPYGGSSVHSRTENPYALGGRTPAWGRTPNPYAEGHGRTPAWTVGSRTPNPYAAVDGGRTPAWNTSSRTPNPYAAGEGGRTPAWAANSRTPNPYTAGGGSGGGSAWGTGAAGSPGWASPRPEWSTDTYGTAPTPGPIAAATPAFNSAATPAVMPTPAASGYTQSAWVYNAQTPAGPSAKTPAMSLLTDEEHVAPAPFEAPSMWLFDPLVLGRNCCVQVRGTRETNYRGGDYEDRYGHVISVSDPRSALDTDAAQEANVHFDGDEKEVVTAFRAEFLVPVPPRAVKDYVLVLHGPRKGQVLVVESLGSEDAPCVVSSVPPGLMFEIESDVLVQIKRTEEPTIAA